jgi:glucan 1,3-beta-glucosidase
MIIKDTPGYQATIVLDNIRLKGNIKSAIENDKGRTVLQGGARTINSWSLGRRYTEQYPNGALAMGDLKSPSKDPLLLYDNDQKFFEQQKPQYENAKQSDFIDVLSFGVKNDGSYPNANALWLNIALHEAASKKKILVFPAGVYKVDDTIHIPPGSRLVGALWSQIMAVGRKFENKEDPKVLAK